MKKLSKYEKETIINWNEAENLRWQLAMSARRIARGEARKLTCPLMSEEDLVQEG